MNAALARGRYGDSLQRSFPAAPALAAIACMAAFLLLGRSESRVQLPITAATSQSAFVENRGQLPDAVAYYARARDATYFFTRTAITVAVDEPGGGAGHAVRIALAGADPAARLEASGPLPGAVNSLVGSDASRWVTDARRFSAVTFVGAWPGIDVRYTGDERGVEAVYEVAPSADPREIALRYDGIGRLTVDTAGRLIADTPLGSLEESAPVAFQQIDGRLVPVDARYTLLDDRTVSFEVGAYDARHRLVIDPSLTYATFLGGSGTDQVNAVTVDGAGNAYVTGLTTSVNFPTVAGSYRTTNSGGRDVFVTKLSPTGSLVYSTYIGGAGLDEGNGIAVDASGNAYITGVTASTNFPTVNAFQALSGGLDDVFVTKLNAAGNAPVYSTYVGGSDDDEGLGIAIDSSNNAYVTGTTLSSNFDILSAFQPAIVDFDAFVTKLTASGSSLGYSTFLGGTGLDEGLAIAVDSSGSAYVTGSTLAMNFPTSSPWRAANGGGRDGFITKLGTAGLTLAYSTYIGGSGSDYGSAIAVDTSGNATVAGLTSSTNFPTASPLQAANAGADDAFVTKLNAAGSAPVFSSYFGGSGGDGASGISLASDSSPAITGSTFSANFPLVGSLQGPGGGGSDAFAAKLTTAGTSLAFSTYLGSTSTDRGWGIAAIGSGQLVIGGSTFSAGFPTAAPAQPAYGGLGDGFVARVNLAGTGSVGGLTELAGAGATAPAHAGTDTLRLALPIAVTVSFALGILIARRWRRRSRSS